MNCKCSVQGALNFFSDHSSSTVLVWNDVFLQQHAVWSFVSANVDGITALRLRIWSAGNCRTEIREIAEIKEIAVILLRCLRSCGSYFVVVISFVVILSGRWRWRRWLRPLSGLLNLFLCTNEIVENEMDMNGRDIKLIRRGW